MKPTYRNKIFLSFLLISNTLTVCSMTFNTATLQDNSETNYVKFEGGYEELSNAFEKISADFNGDGIDDILSLGGDLGLLTGGVTPPIVPVPFAPVELMLYQDGEYKAHELSLGNVSNNANVVDIDADGDLDIVMMTGLIAINDGLANFTLSEYSSNGYSASKFFTVDIDADNDLDIVSKDMFFINNGNLQFSESANSITPESDLFSVVDINNDGVADILVAKENQLQSWINTGNGQFELFGQLEIPGNIDKLHSIDINSDNTQDIILSFRNNEIDSLLILENDGDGNFASNDFILQTGDIEFDTFHIGKFFNSDVDNDGDEDLLIATVFTNNSDCFSHQNLVLLYENATTGNLQHRLSLHSDGYRGIPNTPTVQTYPTIIDLNNDNLPDVVLTGEKPSVWLNNSEFGFRLSNVSSLSFTNYIEAADFNNDGNTDILSSGIYSGNCEILAYSSEILSTTNRAGGHLWLGNEDGNFSPYATGIAGLTHFSGPIEYSKFINLNNSEDLQYILQFQKLAKSQEKLIIHFLLLRMHHL